MYQLTAHGVITPAGSFVPMNANGNADWEAYQAWVADGNIALSSETTTLVQKRLCDQVDRDAEGLRCRFITPGTGKAMSYQEKLAEARLVLDDPQAIDVALVPILAAEATARGITVEQAATLVHQTYLAFKSIEAQINANTITSKAAISAASDAPAAQAAYEAITWPSIP